MESLKLTPQEQTFYGECFQTCDVDGNARISNSRASNLFISSGLSPEVLLQISELCGAKRLGHFGRSQFYIALKLIAAVQNGYPPKLDSLNTGTDMPLPKFTRTADQEKRLHNAVPGQDTERHTQQSVPNQQAVGQLPPPPASKKSHMRSQSGQFRGMVDRDQGPPNPTVISQTSGTHQALNSEESSSVTTSPRQFISPPQSPPSSPPVTNNIQSATSIPSANQNSLPGHMASPVANQIHGAQVMNSLQTGAPTVITGTAPTNIHAGHHHHHHHHHQQQQHPKSSSNSTHELLEGWASFEEDEHAGLLAPGSRKPYNLEPPGFDSSSISSDPESVDDIWSINDDQKEYYIAQFKTMQPDLNKTITGAVAKEFFEKSKLHVHELSKIWQLSDLNRDGELSLDEFCIAMHLVVLRRHDIEIPDRLPFSLMPYTSFTNEEPFAVDHPSGGTLKRATPPETPPSHPQSISESLEPIGQDASSDTASDVASPSVKPLNFASIPVSESDKIVHPIAKRVSPDHHSERGRAFSEPAPPHNDQSESATKKLRAKTESKLNSSQNDIDLLTGDDEVIAGSAPPVPPPVSSRPRPVPPKSLGPVPGNISGLLLPAPTSSHGDNTDGGIEQEPPVPPPRPTGRSLSMDASKGLSTPPAVPPRASPKDSPAARKSGEVSFSAINSKFHEFKKFESIPSEESLNKMAGLDSTDSTTYKGHLQTSGPEAGDSNAGNANASRDSSPLVKFDVPDDEVGGGETQVSLEMKRQLSRDKKELQMAIRTHKERNSTLERLGSELNQELQEVMEQRIALEIQLEHLKPFSS